MANPPQSPARRAAAALLDAVLLRHRSLEEALDALPTDGKPHKVRGKGEARPGAAVSPRDKAAAHRIAAAVLRRAGSIDSGAGALPAQGAAGDGAQRAADRRGGAAAAGHPRPCRGRQRGGPVPAPFAGLVNAVLRKVAEAGPAALEGLDAERRDTPGWLWTAWHNAYGPAVRAIAAAHRIEAPLDLSLKPGATAPEGGAVLPTGTLRYPAGTRVTELAGFAEGEFWVQDAAAALPARLLAVQPGERVVDLCAAPGGKTAQLAAAGAAVTAVERDPKRAARLRENLARLQLPAEVVVTDAVQWDAGGAQFDAVLLDAPCSATGTIRRHPDVQFLKRPKDVPAMAELQRALLAAAAKRLAPGGRLVFATCSLQAEEGEAHLAAAEALGLVVDPVRPEEVPGLAEAITPAGTLRTRPDMWAEHGGMDGFFVARFRKAALSRRSLPGMTWPPAAAA